MKLSIPTICSLMLLTACQVCPNPTDTTPPRLTFGINYEGKLDTPYDTIETSTVTEAERCVYVNTPFWIVAVANDPGGIRSITTGPSRFPFNALVARDEPTAISSIPTPAERTQPDGSGGTYPNPGRAPGSALVRVAFSTAAAYEEVNLHATYEFAPGHTRSALRATARNFGTGGQVSEVYHFHVEKATDDPRARPGMRCAVP